MTSTRPKRPSANHVWDREGKRWLTRKAVEAERNRFLKAADPEFVDIEPVEGPHLAAAGHVKSVSLWEAKRAMGVRGMQELHDVLDAAGELVDWPNSDRARTFHHAGRVVSEAIRQGIDEKRVFIWTLLAEGHGDRAIKTLAWEDANYDLTRYEIRKLSNEFWDLVRAELTNDVE